MQSSSYSQPAFSMSFRLEGERAMFADPHTRAGGEKCSYQVPTYEALKHICGSIYWKPTFIWVVDAVRVLTPFRVRAIGTKTRTYQKQKSDLSYYMYLTDVAYEVLAHAEWNLNFPQFAQDRDPKKHHEIAMRHLQCGGRRHIHLGTSECMGYVSPTEFGSASSVFDALGDMPFPLGAMYHGIDYANETGRNKMEARFMQNVVMQYDARYNKHGIINFPHPLAPGFTRVTLQEKSAPKTFRT